MKKVFKLTALLLIAGAMMMTGCGKGNPDEEDDGLSGTWTKSITYQDQFDSPWTISGNNITFTKTDVQELDIQSGWVKNWTKFISNSAFTGVKLKMSCSSRTSGQSLILADSQNSNRYYRLSLRNSNVLLEQVVDNGDDTETKTDLIHQDPDGKIYYWEDWNTIINQEPGENEIVFYTATDGSMKFLVNNELITSVSDPEIKSFYIAVRGQVDYKDKVAGGTVTSTYKFKKFQTKK